MKAELLFRRRLVLSDRLFAEMVLWRLPRILPGSLQSYKYRLALVADGICILRYDNEAGKGDHRHIGGAEQPYAFTTIDELLEDFEHDIRRALAENSDAEGRKPG